MGWAELHQRLAGIDPNAAAAIAVNDQQRIQRALEVYQITGKPISFWQNQPRSGAVNEQVLKIILDTFQGEKQERRHQHFLIIYLMMDY